ncbi:MAG: SufD family Fe-S cluster assembly protein [Rikenellaceae bacterium]|nr:SufD family Fe-S cluster assembly protein [Rikenellaceae bacterium]
MSRIVKGALAAERAGAFVGSVDSFTERYPEAAAVMGALVRAERDKRVAGDKFRSVPTFAFDKLYGCPDRERGLVVYVPAGVDAGRKITIHVGGVAPGEGRHNCRNYIIVEEGASAFVEVRYAGGLCACGRLAEIWVGRGASLETVTFFDGDDSAADITGTTVAECAEESSFRSTLIASGTRSFTDNTKVILSGAGASAHVNGIALGRGDGRAECNTVVEHAVPDTSSRQLFRMVADDSSRLSFNGCIYVAHGADRTEAYQQNNNVVLTDTARVTALPQLEIYADDVKCSHGSTVGKLSEEAVFYMRQRGIPESEARRLQIEGFVGEVLADIGDMALVEEISEKTGLTR